MDSELFKDSAIKKKLINSEIARTILLWLCHKVDLKDFVFTNRDLLNSLSRMYNYSNIFRLLQDFEFWELIQKHKKNRKFWIISSGSDYFLVKKYEEFTKSIKFK